MANFSTKIQNFMSDSRDVVFMNDVYANNLYLTSMLDARGHEVSVLERHAKNKTQLSKVGYLSASYHIHVMHFRRKIMLFSMFIFLVAALLFGLHFIADPPIITEIKTFFICLSVLLLLYVIMIMIWFKDRNQRSSYYWHRYYFASPQK